MLEIYKLAEKKCYNSSILTKNVRLLLSRVYRKTVLVYWIGLRAAQMQGPWWEVLNTVIKLRIKYIYAGMAF